MRGIVTGRGFASWGWLAWAVAVGAAGCGGATKGSGPSPSTTNVSAETACGDYFDANFGGPCISLVRPANEVARERARYITACQFALGLPGEGVTASDIEGCAQALKASGGCGGGSNAPAACVLRSTGTLAAGASCADQAQCSSGVCARNSGLGCGSCAAITPVGQACLTSGCDGTTCVPDSGTCQVMTYGSAGDACGTNGEGCTPGLTCSSVTFTCEVPAGVGAACRTMEDCDSALICAQSTHTCEPRGSAGQSCSDDSECGADLGCVPNAQGQMQCGPVTWASAGQSCGGATRCLVGGCDVGSGQLASAPGVCPTINADGTGCSLGESSAQCDVFAECFNGICALEDSQQCF